MILHEMSTLWNEHFMTQFHKNYIVCQKKNKKKLPYSFYHMTKYTLSDTHTALLHVITVDKWRVQCYRTDSNGMEELWASDNVFYMCSVSFYIFWQHLPAHLSQKFKFWDSFMSELFFCTSYHKSMYWYIKLTLNTYFKTRADQGHLIEILFN